MTNTMAVSGDDFEKGEADGTHRILALLEAITHSLVEPGLSVGTRLSPIAAITAAVEAFDPRPMIVPSPEKVTNRTVATATVPQPR